MIHQSIPVDDRYVKSSSKLTPRCVAAVVISALVFCGIYSSVRTPINQRLEYGYDDDYERDSTADQELDNLLDADHQRLLYNRVPKCGSTTMLTMMKKLAAQHGFKHFTSKVYDRKIITKEEQRRIVNWVGRKPPPCSFDRHVFFVNFTRFGERPPIYMNIIRDPVERIISSFFYRRMVAATNRTTGSLRVRPSSYWLNKNFEHCVTTPDPECSFIDGRNYSILQIPYFCGQELQCQLHNDIDALQRAKQNIAESYAVVGVLEHMNITLKVLEAVLPQFFKGALRMYHSLGVHRNKNLQKQEVSEEVKLLLKANLTAEYDLYGFVLQRLYDQYRQAVL